MPLQSGEHSESFAQFGPAIFLASLELFPVVVINVIGYSHRTLP